MGNIKKGESRGAATPTAFVAKIRKTLTAPAAKAMFFFSNRKVCIWLPIQHTRFTMNEYTYRLMKL